MAYCSSDDVIARLSQPGIRYQSDDPDGTADDAAMIAEAIEYAGTRVDLHVERFFSPTTVLHGNLYLKHIAVALACYWVATRKAELASESVIADMERAEEDLKAIGAGRLRIPNANYPGEQDTTRTRRRGLPRVWNPGG